MLTNTRIALLVCATWLVAPAAGIHEAARQGDLAAVRRLVEVDRVAVDTKDASGRTALAVAAQHGQLEVARYLLDHDAAIDAADGRGDTPLHKACMRFDPSLGPGQLAVARLLLDRGANVNARNSWGQVALHSVFGALGPDLELLKRLIAENADLNARGRRGEAPLHWAAGAGRAAGVKVLIESGADLDPYDSAYGTPLHEALQQGQLETARLLVEAGASLAEKDPYGYTPLHLAAMRGDAGLVKVLLQRGADSDAGDRYGRTPLFYAARHGRRAAADVLLAAGARQQGVMERNYGKATQLDRPLADGEAYLWFLGFAAQDGYAVKTARHLLLFDPPGMDDSPEAGLANGRLNPKELEDQNVTIFVTKPDWDRFDLAVFDLANRLKGAEVVLAFDPEGRAGDHAIPRYRLAEPGRSFSMGAVAVRTIPATAGGIAVLAEVDGLKVFHNGYHVRNEQDQDQRYRAQIDALADAAPVDITLLPAAGHAITPYTYGAYPYLLDRLSPRAVYLMHGVYGRENYWECATKLLQHGAQVEFPENEGDRFHYRRPSAPPTGGSATSAGRAPSRRSPRPLGEPPSTDLVHPDGGSR